MDNVWLWTKALWSKSPKYEILDYINHQGKMFFILNVETHHFRQVLVSCSFAQLEWQKLIVTQYSNKTTKKSDRMNFVLD